MMNYDENDQFREFRNDCLKFAKVAEKTIIEEWLEKIGYNEPVGYSCSLSDRVMTIYTTRPGVLIGKAGNSVREFEAMLTDRFCGIWTVKFVEVRGGFVNTQEIEKEKYREIWKKAINQFAEKMKNKDGNEFVVSWFESKDECYEFDNDAYEKFIDDTKEEMMSSIE